MRSLGTEGGHIFMPIQACFGLCMCCGDAVQTGWDRILGTFELGQVLVLAGQGVLYFGELVFIFHNAACGGNDTVGEGTISALKRLSALLWRSVRLDSRRATSDLSSLVTAVRAVSVSSSNWVSRSIRVLNVVVGGYEATN